MEKPLIVFTGQGLSLADNFNLTAELKRQAPDIFSIIPEADRDNLDSVLARYRVPYINETIEEAQFRNSQHIKIQEIIYQLTEKSTFISRNMDTTMELCSLLKEVSLRRPVVLFTCNVDRACKFASLANGAEWFFGHEIIGETSIENILSWIEKVKNCKYGFHYFPLHGESDFLSTGDGGTYFASKEHVVNKSYFDKNWYWTTAEGLGPHTKTIDSTWRIAMHGYNLIYDLLIGKYGTANACNGADLVTIGYGAGGSPLRCEYPFERTIKQAFLNFPRSKVSTWHAILREGDKTSIEWYSSRKFAIHSVREPKPNCLESIRNVLGQL